MNKTWKYMGCSAQRQPSLSNVAMRYGTGTKSGEPGFVTFSTNWMIACLDAVSFYEGSGSAARLMVAVNASAPTSAAARRFCMRGGFMIEIEREQTELTERGCGRRPSRSALNHPNVLRLVLRTQPRSGLLRKRLEKSVRVVSFVR
jgi:hypothetical protein